MKLFLFLLFVFLAIVASMAAPQNVSLKKRLIFVGRLPTQRSCFANVLYYVRGSQCNNMAFQLF